MKNQHGIETVCSLNPPLRVVVDNPEGFKAGSRVRLYGIDHTCIQVAGNVLHLVPLFTKSEVQSKKKWWWL